MIWGTAEVCASGRRVSVVLGFGVWVLLLVARGISPVTAQTNYSPVVITPPIVDTVDDNHVSLISGKLNIAIPALKLGDVSFTPFSANGPHFDQGGLLDENYGYVINCASANPGQGLYATTTECALPGNGSAVQAIYGQTRATFSYYNGQYSAWEMDGSSFADNGNFCTWTMRDGTQIVYAAYHAAGNPTCLSNNIAQIIHPDGRIATYFYYGAFATTPLTLSPILGIATNSGYVLKYNYPGTPTWGAETSVVAINRAFETCDPSAITCSVAPTWPTATMSWQWKMVSTSDDFQLPFSNPLSSYDPYRHYIFTLTTASHKQHIFELDSYFRVVSYQPPEATSPVYTYSLCSLLSDFHTLRDCFDIPRWYNDGIHAFEQAPILFDMVHTVVRNGQTWHYYENYAPPNPAPGWSTWYHTVQSPLGPTMAAEGNSTPGQEQFYGPIDEIDYYDGTVDHFERNTRNALASRQTVAGIVSTYQYDTMGNLRGNLWGLVRYPVSGSNLAPVAQGAIYPTSCTNVVTCNKPTSVTDANGNTSSFSYDPVHGGVLTVTGPTVNGVQPQTRSTYVLRNAWFLNSSGVMVSETRPIWLLASESFCRTGPPAASGPGCALSNDEVLRTYDYGPDSGPNNLLVRGKVISADGETHRICYGHDSQGNKIWETSPNANRSSCPDY